MFIAPYIKAGYACLYVRSTEQERVMEEINRDLKAADVTGLNIMIWKSTTGLHPWLAENPKNEQVAYDLVESLNYIKDGERGETPEERLYIFFNPKKFLTENPVAIQALRDAAYAIRLVGSHIILVGGGIDLPEELEDVVTFVDFDLPSKEELKKTFKQITDNYKDMIDGEITEDVLEVAADAAAGMTALTAENAVALSIVEAGELNINILRKEKQQAVKKSGVLEFIHHSESMSTLGGFDNLKEHVMKRKRFFHEHKKALAFGLTPPKGVMLIGVGGTGKTLASKAIASALNLPLVRFNLGSVFGSLVGQSEQRIRDSIKLIEAVAPVVCLIDKAVA